MKAVLAGLFVVLILLQVRLWVGAGGVAEIARLENEIDEQTEENATLDARNSTLMEEVGDLRNGLDSIEERARNELGLIRRGETFYLIVDKEATAMTPAASEVTQLPETTVVPEPAPIEIASEPPPEIVEEDNPYLEVFRDEEDTAEQAQAPAAETGSTVGQ
jgi:cell division protein FtsB